MKQLYIISFIVLLSLSSGLKGQNVASHYFLDNLPESSKLNPAFMPNCNFYLDLPGIGSTYAGLSSDIGFQDVFSMNKTTGLLQVPFNSPDLLNSFVNGLNQSSFLETEANINLFGFGFKTDYGYFHFNTSERIISDVRMPSSFFRLNQLANKSNEYYGTSHDLSGLGMNVLVYQEISAGLTYDLSSKLKVGGKVKLLLGHANASLNFKDLRLATSTVETSLSGEIEARQSSPMEVVLDEDDVPSFNEDQEFDIGKDGLDYLLAFKNLGFAIDLGAEYMVLPNLSISASVLDLGMIKWKSNPFNYKVEGEATFEGVDELVVYDDEGRDDYFDNLIDSMGDQFTLTPGFDPYSTSLVPKLFVGAEYQVSPVFSAGLLSRTRFYNTGIRENIYLSANLNLFHVLTAGAHYNWAWSEPNTLGFTLAVKLLPFQFYVSTDMMPTAYRRYTNPNDFMELGLPENFIGPTQFNGLNVQVGMNLVFGCRKKKNVPLYELLGD